jgi:polyphosphate glucokinase
VVAGGSIRAARCQREVAMQVLVIDVGGRSVKLLLAGQSEPVELPSGPEMTPRQMVEAVQKATADWTFDRIAMGYPGPIRDNRPVKEPANLGRGWVGYDYEGAFDRPVRMLNDAAMQALGSYQGGRMLFVGLGTGMGSAMVLEGLVLPMELGHLPYRRGTFEDYVGRRGLRRLGRTKWLRHVLAVLDLLQAALLPDYVLLGGGKADEVEPLPPYVRRGNNDDAFRGGFLLWESAAPSQPPAAGSDSDAGER